MKTKILVALAVLGLSILPIRSTERSKSAHKQFTAYLYVEIEAKVYRKGIEISSENPEERRWYFSNVVEQPEDSPVIFTGEAKDHAVLQS